MPIPVAGSVSELLDRAGTILSGVATASASDRERLADRLERWRYQILNAPETPDRQELDDVDRASRALLGEAAPGSRRILDTIASGPVSGAERRFRDALDLDDATLEDRARTLTRDLHHGRVLLYAPLYVASHCANRCAYCGFSLGQPIGRRALDPDETRTEAQTLVDRGFRHQLLVAGDFPRITTVDYLAGCVRVMTGLGVDVAIEVAAQGSLGYRALRAAGARGVTLYMETYDRASFARHHLAGPKSSYPWRLEALDRAAEAGFPRLGLGILLGLADPVGDIAAMLRHAEYLRARHPEIRLAFSLPRIHEAPDGFRIEHPVGDPDFVRFYAALRLALPEATLVLSTRESEALRDRLAGICITQMSAESETAPGGYAGGDSGSGEQFPVSDRRSLGTVEAMLRDRGLEPVRDPAASR